MDPTLEVAASEHSETLLSAQHGQGFCQVPLARSQRRMTNSVPEAQDSACWRELKRKTETKLPFGMSHPMAHGGSLLRSPTSSTIPSQFGVPLSR